MERIMYRLYRRNLHRPGTPRRPARPTPLDWFTAAPIRALAWYLTRK